MHHITFTLKTFLAHPFNLATYGVLIAAFISLWVYKRAWIWAPLVLASIILAYFSHIIDDKALLPIGLLAGCHLCLRTDIKGPIRIILVTIASIISVGLMLHYMPGFNNWLIVKDYQISPNSYPFTLYFNFDKPFVGIFVLGLNLSLIKTAKEWGKAFLQIGFWTALTVLVLLGLSFAFGVVHFDAKFPPITLPWIIANIFFVCAPEEAFWRGFLQREIINGIKEKTKWAPAIAIGSISAFFALIHVFFVPHISYLFLAFIASTLYGMTYHFTKKIECAILVHFLLNTIQFFFFTYPALA